MLPTRLYTASAMAWALALYGLLRWTLARVRSAVSPWRVTGATAGTGWDAVQRWTRDVRARRLFAVVRAAPAGWPLRQMAARTATTLGGYALPSPEPPGLDVLAFHGAARAR